MSETYAKRTVRGARTQDTYNPSLGDVTKSAQKRMEKETFCHKKPDLLIIVVQTYREDSG